MRHRTSISIPVQVVEGFVHQEELRIDDLLRIVPKGRSSVLDIGARDGRISTLLASHFESVTALDLVKPDIAHDGIRIIQGDVTRLAFADDSFDVVLCAEVLEHIRPEVLAQACSEIVRVAAYDVVIGVPYKQDLRVARTKCLSCGRINPPWGHMTVFDRSTLLALFEAVEPVTTSLVGMSSGRTNFISALLMNIAGNPWGTYEQHEACIYCGCAIVQPDERRSLVQRACSGAASAINRTQELFLPERPNWLHMVFRKRPFERRGG